MSATVEPQTTAPAGASDERAALPPRVSEAQGAMTALAVDAVDAVPNLGGAPTKPRGRMRLVVAGVVVLALVGGTWVVLRDRELGAASGTGTGTATEAKATTTAKVTRRDLVERTTVDGTLGYGDATVLSGPQGTVTWVPQVGAVIERGQTVAEVDAEKVPLLYGTVPLWRPLSGAVAKGPDIRVLEENLQALGYADGLAMTVDEQWDDATLTAVTRWQAALGRDQTGTVQPGDAIVHDGPARIAKVTAKVGQPSQGAGGIVEATGTTRTVQAKVKASEQSLVAVGDAVVVELPGNRSTKGRITEVGSVAAAESSENGGSSEATLTVGISLDDARAPGSLDQAPVSVKVTSRAAKDVLAVPVNALLALKEGGYAVEVKQGSGSHLAGVKLGAFADGWVQITGDVHEGDPVVVPR